MIHSFRRAVLALLTVGTVFLFASCAGGAAGGSDDSTTLAFNFADSNGRALDSGTTVYLAIVGDYEKSVTAKTGEITRVENVPVGARIGVAVAATVGGDTYLAACKEYTVKDGENKMHLTLKMVALHGGESYGNVQLSVYTTEETSAAKLDLPNGICSWSLRYGGNFSEAGNSSSVSVNKETFLVRYADVTDPPNGYTYSGTVYCTIKIGSFSKTLTTDDLDGIGGYVA